MLSQVSVNVASTDQAVEHASIAKTPWLAAEDKDHSTNLLPFGWLLGDLQPSGATTGEWSKHQPVYEPHLVAAYNTAGRGLVNPLVRRRCGLWPR